MTAPQVSTSGVVGAAGRYPIEAAPARPLRLGGTSFVPVGPLRVYTCGITPYDVTHVGHAATFVWADLVSRVARARGVATHLTRNVTDVDDVLTEAAERRGVHYDELAATQEFEFDRDMRALGVAPPSAVPHARAHVDAVVRLAAALLDRDAAYEADGWVWFRGAAVPAGLGLSEGEALRLSEEYGDQAEHGGRAHPLDVPVWRPSADRDPAWPSPWGWGRPGWHAECTAMALVGLGSSVDVLVGGADLAFPHHAYQTALAEEATGVTPFARAVLHVGEVRVAGRKMAKSVGNLVLVRDLLATYDRASLRLGLLHRDWREPWDCTDEVWQAAGETASRLAALAGGAEQGERAGPAHELVLAPLSEDLDVPGAVAAVLDAGDAEAARCLLDVLGMR